MFVIRKSLRKLVASPVVASLKRRPSISTAVS
jgi:hypothetical protein